MATTNLDSADLKAVLAGGLIREDVMDRIFDLSDIDLEFTSRCGKGSHSNSYVEWTKDSLGTPSLTNAKVDGSDQDTANDTTTGSRLGNHSQISTKTIQVSSRADESDTIGRAKELIYQVSRGQEKLRRDIEATCLTGQASVADDGATIAGKSAGVFAQLSVVKNLGATGTIGGFNTGTKLFPAIAQGTKRALTETIVKDVMQAIYQAGDGRPTVFMSAPGVIRKFSEFQYTAGTVGGARVAQLVSDVGQDDDKDTAKGAVNRWRSDFGVLSLVPNRLQQDVAASVSNVGIYDFNYINLSYLRGFRAESLAKKGLSESRMISADWSLIVTCPEACAAITDVDYAVAVTQ